MDRCPTPLEVDRMIRRVRERARRRKVIGYDLARAGGPVMGLTVVDVGPTIPARLATEWYARNADANRAVLARAWLSQLP